MKVEGVKQQQHQQENSTDQEKDELYKYSNDCEKEGFRNFSPGNALFDRVFNMYTMMHTNQCVEYVQKK